MAVVHSRQTACPVVSSVSAMQVRTSARAIGPHAGVLVQVVHGCNKNPSTRSDCGSAFVSCVLCPRVCGSLLLLVPRERLFLLPCHTVSRSLQQRRRRKRRQKQQQQQQQQQKQRGRREPWELYFVGRCCLPCMLYIRHPDSCFFLSPIYPVPCKRRVKWKPNKRITQDTAQCTLYTGW